MSINQALAAWKQGKLVVLPTETVYGLGAPVDKIQLLQNIFHLKERPLFDPLIVHVSTIEMARRYCDHWDDRAEQLAQAFWPGPLTLVLTKNHLVDDVVTAGLPTVGLRMPRHEVALTLIDTLGVGVAAPSANRFTKTSPTRIDHARKYFSSDDVYFLEGGECEVGIESTIIAVGEEKLSLLRPGMISVDEIAGKTGLMVEEKQATGTVQAPGDLQVHYRPPYPLVTVACSHVDQRILEKYNEEFAGSAQVITLNEEAPLVARRLYGALHTPLDNGCTYKVVNLQRYHQAADPEAWHGILDRLKKASQYFLLKGPWLR